VVAEALNVAPSDLLDGYERVLSHTKPSSMPRERLR